MKFDPDSQIRLAAASCRWNLLRLEAAATVEIHGRTAGDKRQVESAPLHFKVLATGLDGPRRVTHKG
jgi:hypothetical protein